MTLFYLALAWLAGVFLASIASLSWWMWLVGAVIPLLGAILLRGRATAQTVCGCLLLLLLGAARYAASVPTPAGNDIALYNDQPKVTLHSMIANAPEVTDTGTTLIVEAKSLALADGLDVPVRGLVLVTTSAAHTYHYGDVVTVRGTLETPPAADEGFSYREYLARRGIYSVIRFAQVKASGDRQGSPPLAALYDFRTDAYQRIDRLLPEPESSLLQGILLGLDEGISPRVRDDFNAVSASHIIAISGMNIAIVAGLLMGLARRLMRENFAVIVTSLGIVLYTLFVGANSSVIRAAIMSILVLAASQLGRQTYGPASLGFSALVMTAIQPVALWDAGFELSFLATFGLIFYVEPLQKLLAGWLLKLLSEGRAKQVIDLITESLVVTVAAQIATTPFILLVFRRFSLVSLPANFLIIPVQPEIMVWGILGLGLSYVVWPIGQLCAWIAWLFLAWTIWTVRSFAALPFASLGLENPSPALIGGIYVLMLLMTVVAQQPEERRAGWWQALTENVGLKALASAGLVIALLIGLGAASLPDGQLHVRFINTNSAAAVLVATPSGRHILIDAGGSGRVLSAALGDTLPFWSRSLDVVILTQSTEAHIAALPDVLSRYQIESLVTNGTPGGQLYGSIQATLASQHTQVIVARPGSQISIGDGVRLTILDARAGDAASNDPGDPVTLMLAYRDVRLLLPGSLTPDSASRLLSQNVAAPIVFLQDLNNPSLTDPAFLSAVNPRIVIASVADNPSPDALARLAGPGIELHRLDQANLIELVTDGSRVDIRAGR